MARVWAPATSARGRSFPGHEQPPWGPKTAKSWERPRTCPFFGIQTGARLPPPHPVALARRAPWDEAEPESETPIMSYDLFFASFRVYK